jgi:hypothetical protein
VWGAHWYGPTKTLDVHMAALRRKLGHGEWIRARRGVSIRSTGMTRRLIAGCLAVTAFVICCSKYRWECALVAQEHDRLVAAIEHPMPACSPRRSTTLSRTIRSTTG